MLNKVIIVGNLGADPEVKTTNNGKSVASLRIATNERWTDANGESHERTEWHRIVVWAKLAELCGQYLKKGSRALVEGSLRTRSYEKDGVNHSVTEIVASSVQFLDKKTTAADTAEPDFSSAPPPMEKKKTAPKNTPKFAPAEDDDIPF